LIRIWPGRLIIVQKWTKAKKGTESHKTDKPNNVICSHSAPRSQNDSKTRGNLVKKKGKEKKNQDKKRFF
jgi:folate-dependent tRNA-U54 methylase TrmFO/GidA